MIHNFLTASPKGKDHDKVKTASKREGSPNDAAIKKKKKSDEVVKETSKKLKTPEKEEKDSKPKKSPKSSTTPPPKVDCKVNTAPKPFFSLNASAKKDSNNLKAINYQESIKKTKYHPIDDALWKRGEKTPYMAFAKALAGNPKAAQNSLNIKIQNKHVIILCMRTPNRNRLSVHKCQTPPFL